MFLLHNLRDELLEAPEPVVRLQVREGVLLALFVILYVVNLLHHLLQLLGLVRDEGHFKLSRGGDLKLALMHALVVLPRVRPPVPVHLKRDRVRTPKLQLCNQRHYRLHFLSLFIVKCQHVLILVISVPQNKQIALYLRLLLLAGLRTLFFDDPAFDLKVDLVLGTQDAIQIFVVHECFLIFSIYFLLIQTI